MFKYFGQKLTYNGQNRNAPGWKGVPPVVSTGTTDGEYGYHRWVRLPSVDDNGWVRWVRVPSMVSTGTTGGEYGYHRWWVRVPPVLSTGTTGGEYGYHRWRVRVLSIRTMKLHMKLHVNFQCKSCETPVELHVELHVELPVELCGTFRLIYIDMYNTHFVYIRCQNKTPRPFFDLRPDFNSWHPENSKNAFRLPIR